MEGDEEPLTTVVKRTAPASNRLPQTESRRNSSSELSGGADLILILIMRKVAGRHLLCLLLLAFPFSWAEDTRNNVKKSDNTGLSQAKAKRLFARRKISSPLESHIPKNKSSLTPPARRCGRLMESCSPHVPCCDPCASCRCRLFNTICHCWRMNPLCLKKT
ncbi:Agouti-related protein [Liparis tanakae]|uniref:Agouti-related protein n=1 Tax=Liparis tanakae TaxID=230148 RepID=A0A4Z2HW24_9TELE|nr:Agouti-related protein [Liparis tanakae]